MIQLKIPSLFFPFLFWSIILFYLFLLLIGPKVSDSEQKKYCVRNFEINSFLGHSMNCDSADFMKNAIEPKKLLEENSIRSARPGLIWAAHLIAIPINKITETLNSIYKKKTKINNEGIKIHPKIIYISFILINFFLLFSSIYFFFKIFGNSIFNILHYKIWYLWFAQFLVINEITHQFFWSPHTPILNIFNAVISIYFALKIIKDKKSNILIYSFFLGLFLLSYASFVISFVFLISIYSVKKFIIENKSLYPKSIIKIILSIILFFLPYFIWYSYVVSINGNFYFQNLTEYPLLLWISDYTVNHGYLKTMTTILSSFFLFNYYFFKLHILLFFYYIVLFFIIIPNRKFQSSQIIFIITTFYIICYSMFYTLLGTGAHSRIVTGLLVPILIMFSQFFRENKLPIKKSKSVMFFSLFSLVIYAILFANKFGNYT